MTGRGRGRGRGETKLYLNLDSIHITTHETEKPGGVNQPFTQKVSDRRIGLFQTNIFQKSVTSIKQDAKRKQDITLSTTPKYDVKCGVTSEQNQHREIMNTKILISDDVTETQKPHRKKKVKEREWDRGKSLDVNTGIWHSNRFENHSRNKYIITHSSR